MVKILKQPMQLSNHILAFEEYLNTQRSHEHFSEVRSKQVE
jgi:hypothetical protein